MTKEELDKEAEKYQIEKRKGYKEEHSSKDVIAWKEIVPTKGSE